MGIQLTDEEVTEIREHARQRLQASFIEYERLLGAVREKLPTVTDEAIAIVKERFSRGTHQDDGQAATHAMLACAVYQLAISLGGRYIKLLKDGRGDAEVLRNLMWTASWTWESLGALAFVINGAPLAQGFIDAAIRQHAAERAANAARTRHEPANEAKKWVRQQWVDHGHDYASKADFARKYVELAKEEYDVKVSAKTIAEEWLSPSALKR